MAILMRSSCCLMVLLASVAGAADDAASLPRRFRDFKIYATSAPDAADTSRINVQVQLHNDGDRPLQADATLWANANVGFAGVQFTGALKPGAHVTWQFHLRPPAGLVREVIEGSIRFGPVEARWLFIAVRGPDPPDFSDDNVEKITEKAQVVAVYAPRAQEAIRLLRVAAAYAIGKRSVVIASVGRSDYRLVIEPMPESVKIDAHSDATAVLDAWRAIKDQQTGTSELIAAVSDLVRCIEIKTDTSLPIARNGEPAIRLRLSGKMPGGKAWPHTEAYRLVVDGDVLIESSTLDGLRQGVYGLLTDYMDCHWFLPRSMGEEIIVPKDRTVRLPRLNELQLPSFFSVSGMSWSNARPWDRRNRAWINRGRMTFGHSWQGYVKKEAYPYEEYPDMWARDREGRVRKFDKVSARTNFCSTSPKVLDIVAAIVNRALANPDAIVTSLDPNDYALMCLCDRCLALDKSYGVQGEDGTKVADRLLHFSKEIYDRLDEKNKGKYLGILVYGYQMDLPVSARPHPYHTGLICDMPWRYDHTRPFNDATSPRNREFHRLLKGWGAILTQFGYYDYYGHWAYWGPWGVVHKMREDLPAFRDLGGTYLMIESQPNFAIHGLNLYTASRLAWNVDADVDLLLDEFYTKFYGPAAEPMRQYWQTIDKHQALTRSGSNVHERVATRPGIWEELAGHLAQAEQLADDADKRFQDRIRFHTDGMLWGQRRAEIEIAYDVRLTRPATVSAKKNKDRDFSGAVELLEKHREWFEATFQKYGGGGHEYWPALTPGYFRPQIDGMIKAMKEHAEDRDKK